MFCLVLLLVVDAVMVVESEAVERLRRGCLYEAMHTCVILCNVLMFHI